MGVVVHVQYLCRVHDMHCLTVHLGSQNTNTYVLTWIARTFQHSFSMNLVASAWQRRRGDACSDACFLAVVYWP